jgi:hypothetical protein
MKNENFSQFRTRLLERVKKDFGLNPNDLDLHEPDIRSYYVLDWTIEKILDYYEEKFDLTRIQTYY